MSVVKSISAADVLAHTANGEGVVVDARPQVLRHQGSLPGAIVVEPGDVTRIFDHARPAGVRTRDTEIAVVSVRSEAVRIAEQIADLGYTNVHYVDGGFSALRSVGPV